MRKKKNPQVYFTKDTEKQLVNYIKSNSIQEKNKIYTDYLYFPLDEMIKINIHVHKFYHTGHDIESLVQETHLHLNERFRTFSFDEITGFDKFDPTEGEAYSYCNRMIKNFLIQTQEKNQIKKMRIREESMEDDMFNEFKENLYDDFDEFEQEDIMYDFMNFFISFCKEKVPNLIKNESELEIVYNILSILEIDEVEINNKKTFLTILKNTTNEKNYKISKVLKILKKLLIQSKRQFFK